MDTNVYVRVCVRVCVCVCVCKFRRAVGGENSDIEGKMGLGFGVSASVAHTCIVRLRGRECV